MTTARQQIAADVAAAVAEFADGVVVIRRPVRTVNAATGEVAVTYAFTLTGVPAQRQSADQNGEGGPGPGAQRAVVERRYVVAASAVPGWTPVVQSGGGGGGAAGGDELVDADVVWGIVHVDTLALSGKLVIRCRRRA